MVASVWYLSLTPRPPEIDLGISFFDKISHFTAYATLMGWFMQLYPRIRTRLFYAAGFIGMGILIEFLQGLGPARLFEYADMLANALGVLVLLSISQTGMANLLYLLEQKLLNSPSA